MGNKTENIYKGFQLLDNTEGLTLLKQSSLFHSKALYNEDLDDFVNAAALFECKFSAHELLRITQNIEKEFGRKQRPEGAPYEARKLDIDIIFFGQQIIQDNFLTIPHPQFTKRKFVLAPLDQIFLNYDVPGESKTLKEILRDCPDTSELREHK